MESLQLLDLVDQLDDNLGDLEEVLKPILEDSLGAASKKLPILDRAKLNITVVYAIESLLFSYLRVNGVDAREHPVFKELERVKRYFGKVKEAEEKSVVARPSITLNKQAAARIIQSSLAGNGTSDPAQRERELRERLLAKRKLKAAATTAEPVPTSTPEPVPAPASITTPLSVPAVPAPEDQSSAEEGEIEDSDVPMQEATPQQINGHQNPPSSRKRKHKQDTGQSSKKADKKARKKARKQAKARP
ncbi:hypothetical protein H2198_006793 [Neophaeococcomyces mojaviensis]|uniref:Uncharacterized protein n=1 Tax=Neophaeococcomyces mojaviensis TaxID=3383035 RepID=A0ACC3A1Y0_9EURO|nr:hypothetical protein H2198_006793 [Knufia sp. JES_112]